MGGGEEGDELGSLKVHGVETRSASEVFPRGAKVRRGSEMSSPRGGRARKETKGGRRRRGMMVEGRKRDQLSKKRAL